MRASRRFRLATMAVALALLAPGLGASPAAAATKHKPAPKPNGTSLVPAVPAEAVPAITAGPAGSNVTIRGGNFGTATPIVTFGGVPATAIVSHTNTTIVAQAPAAPNPNLNRSGAVDVGVQVGAYSTTFHNGFSYGPVVKKPSSASPASGIPNDVGGPNLIITGTNFGPAGNPNLSVTFKSYGMSANSFTEAPAFVDSNTSTSISVEIPDPPQVTPTSGLMDLIVNNGTYQTTVTGAFSFGPMLKGGPFAAPPGSNVTINGKNFDINDGGDPTIELADSNTGGADFLDLFPNSCDNSATGSCDSDTFVQVQMPDPPPTWELPPASGLMDLNIIAGSNTMTGLAFLATFPNGLTFGPLVKSPTTAKPAAGKPGSSLTIHGLNFGSSPTVTIGGVTALVTSHTNTTVTVKIPQAAPSPPGAGLVDIQVTGSYTTANGHYTYTYTVPGGFSYGPVVRKDRPLAAKPGAKLTIAGANFALSPVPTVVLSSASGSLSLAPTSHSATSLVVTLPSSIPSWTPASGLLNVSVTSAGYTTTLANGFSFGPVIRATQ